VPGIEDEIRAGLLAVERGYTDGWDSLCCGLAGRTEAFAVAADRLSAPAYEEMARRGAGTLLDGLGEGLRLPAPHSTNPGLFQGVSGVGYQLLRVADPSIPSLLLWE
jgi:lantibiotic modifying enzyme